MTGYLRIRDQVLPCRFPEAGAPSLGFEKTRATVELASQQDVPKALAHLSTE